MVKRKIIFVSIVCLSTTAFSVQALTQAAEISQSSKKIAESLNIDWYSIKYEKTLYNPVQTSNK